MKVLMRIDNPKSDLLLLVQKQIDNIFTINDCERTILSRVMPTALKRTEYCFSRIKNKYYRNSRNVYFNPFHSGQYSIFLYYIANSVFRQHRENTLSDKIYYLNKCLNSLDLFYAVEMPKVFFLDHPVGSVLGRAKYGEYFSFSQNCTVGNNKGQYPIFGKNVQMMSGAKVLGKCVVGDNVIFSANSYIKDTDIPPCSIVFGQSPHNIIEQRTKVFFQHQASGVWLANN